MEEKTGKDYLSELHELSGNIIGTKIKKGSGTKSVSSFIHKINLFTLTRSVHNKAWFAALQ